MDLCRLTVLWFAIITVIEACVSYTATPGIQVWDNGEQHYLQSELSIPLEVTHGSVLSKVLTPNIREILHEEAKRAGLGHRVFSRPLSSSGSAIENTVDAILSQVGDDSKYVEYWTRQEWRSIEAHADVDEFLAKKEDAVSNTNSSDFRYPTNGHVLYLKIGSQVLGPTCVFPGRRSGGDLLNADLGESVELVTVPALEGRLLRFGGDALHAVPRPTDLWFLKFVQGAAQYEPEEEFGRSVILFNTWDVPPLDVPVDGSISSESIRGGGETCNEKSEWRIAYSSHAPADNETCDNQSQRENRLDAKIWLLGNLRRRGHQMRTLKLSAPVELKDALHEKSTVTRSLLNQIDV